MQKEVPKKKSIEITPTKWNIRPTAEPGQPIRVIFYFFSNLLIFNFLTSKMIFFNQVLIKKFDFS